MGPGGGFEHVLKIVGSEIFFQKNAWQLHGFSFSILPNILKRNFKYCYPKLMLTLDDYDLKEKNQKR